MPNDQLQWLKLNDFSPGIMQKLNRLSGDTVSFPVGAADATNTFRCIALPGGGLGPLPAQGATYARTGGNPDGSVTIGKIFNGRFTISGAHIAGPVFAAGATGFTKQELHIAYEWGANVSGTQYTRKYTWERHRLWEATPTVDTMVGYATSDDSPMTTFQARPTWFHTYRADASSALNLGAPLVVGGWYAGGGGLTQRFWDTFPSAATLGTTGVGSISSSKNPEGIFGHQGRSVELDQNSWTHGAVGTWSFNEQVYYTAVNLASLAHTTAAVYAQEDAQGFGAFASMNASELMFVRVGYGGYIVRGDLDNPTVLFVPGIPGTGNTRHNAAITPIGLVYGSRNGGLWAWAGGDTADFISPSLEDNFWQPSDGTGDFVDYAGKMAFWREWILTPNNWLYDWRNKSFWRIEDPSVVSIYHWLQSSESHVIYGCPRDIGNATTPSLYNWQHGTPATSYSWESQVLPLGDYKTAQPREFLLKAQGVGTVAFTVSGFDASGSLITESHTFTFASTARPEYQRCTIGSFHALTDCRIKLVATATSTQTPIIYEAQLGYRSDPHLATI